MVDPRTFFDMAEEWQGQEQDWWQECTGRPGPDWT